MRLDFLCGADVRDHEEPILFSSFARRPLTSLSERRAFFVNGPQTSEGRRPLYCNVTGTRDDAMAAFKQAWEARSHLN
jgi:hypothetical protein